MDTVLFRRGGHRMRQQARNLRLLQAGGGSRDEGDSLQQALQHHCLALRPLRSLQSSQMCAHLDVRPDLPSISISPNIALKNPSLCCSSSSWLRARTTGCRCRIGRSVALGWLGLPPRRNPDRDRKVHLVDREAPTLPAQVRVEPKRPGVSGLSPQAVAPTLVVAGRVLRICDDIVDKWAAPCLNFCKGFGACA